MMTILKECFFYVLFIYFLLMVSYGGRDPASHTLYSALYKEFHDGAYVNAHLKNVTTFDKVKLSAYANF